jgi:hypothetical protein
MVGSQKRGRRNQSLTLTLKLLRQAPDGAILLDDLEKCSVPLLLDLRQLRDHPRADQAHPYKPRPTDQGPMRSKQ